MTVTITALQKQRRDTASNWTSNNPTLLAGEWGIESDTKKFKIGDGSTAWQSLDYVPIPDTNRLLTGNLTVGGNFTVNGTTTTIDTTTLTVEDKNIEIGKVSSPSDTTADGGGITLKGATDKTINWVDSTDSWTLSEHLDLASGKVLKVAGTQILSATTLGSSVVSSSLTSVGTIATGTWNATAISGSKVTPDFGSQNIVTTGSISGAAGTLTGDLTIPDTIVHTGDSNTKIRFPAADTFSVETGGVERLSLGATTIFNESGADVDFRIEGDTEANLFYVDASNDRIGIGENTPSVRLHIKDTETTGGVGIKLTNVGEGGSNTVPYCFINANLNEIRNGGEIRFGRDSNYGSAANADSFMAFYTALDDTNTERMRIDSSGRVGIGDSSPDRELVVKNASSNSSIKIKASNAHTSQLFFSDTDAENVARISVFHGSGSDQNSMLFGTGSSTRLAITSAGNVGIGTISPSAQLEIEGNVSSTTQFSGFQGLRIHNANGSAHGITADINFVVGTSTNNRGAVIGAQFTSAASGNDLYFATNPNAVGTNDTPIERMRIDSAGRVGIGTTSPNARVEIAHSIGGGGGTGLILNDFGSSGAAEGLHIEWRSGTDKQADQCRIGQSSNSTGNGSDLFFATNSSDSGSSTERMRIDSSGRVMIGTTSVSPANSYSDNLVVSEASGDGGISIHGNNSNSNYASLYLGDAGAAQRGYLEMQLGSNGNFTIGANGTGPMRFTNNGGERMRIDSLGGLRLNTTGVNLADELFSITEAGTGHEIAGFRVNNASHTKNMINMAHVANSGDRIMFKFMRTGSLTQVGRIVTSASSTTFDTSSDYRLKENEVLISDGITRLKTLKPYRFNFKIEPDKTVDGFFAHEVSSAVPEAVTGEKDAVETTYYTNGDTIPDGKAVGDVKEENAILSQGLDYSKFTPLLTAALQEAIAKIETLETKVAALKAA